MLRCANPECERFTETLFDIEITENGNTDIVSVCEECFKNNDEDKVKFECDRCGCYFWVNDRDNFKCPNCEEIDIENQKRKNDEMREAVVINKGLSAIGVGVEKCK